MGQENVTASFDSMLEARGVSRRDFLKLCGAVAVAAGLTTAEVPQVAHALEASVIGATSGKLFPVLWIEGASCTGCTESFAQVESPDAGTVVLELLSLNYSDVLSAGAGHSLELAKKQTIEAGNYIVVYEGAITQGFGGNTLRVALETGEDILAEAAANAVAVVALGSCAVNGGWMAAYPNPANATGVQAFLKSRGIGTTVINIPGCPANPEWIVSVLVSVIMLNGATLNLDEKNKPADIFGQTIHDNCERRGHFENGEFVYEFGSKEESLGYCLYPLGCKGPQTQANCGVTLWNNRRSWCIQAGAPCIGCCEADPDDPGDNWVEVNTPFYERHRDLHVGDTFFQPTVAAVGITGLVAAALVAHGIGMKKTGRMDGGADFETIRAWDAKNPEKSIGQYEYSVMDGDPLKMKAAQDAIKANYAAAKAGAVEAADEAAETADEFALEAKEALEDVAETAEGFAETAADEVADVAEEATEFAEETVEDAFEVAEDAAEDVAEFVDDAAEAVEDAAEDAAEFADEALDDAAEAVEDAVEAVEETVEDAAEAVEDVAEDIADAAEEAFDVVEDAADAAADAVDDVLDDAADAAADAIDDVIDEAIDVADDVADAVDDAVDVAADAVDDVAEAADEAIDETVDAVKEAVEDIIKTEEEGR